MFRMADVAFASRLVSIFDHFISAGRAYSRAFSPASFNAAPSRGDSSCAAASPMPRFRSRMISPAARRPDRAGDGCRDDPLFPKGVTQEAHRYPRRFAGIVPAEVGQRRAAGSGRQAGYRRISGRTTPHQKDPAPGPLPGWPRPAGWGCGVPHRRVSRISPWRSSAATAGCSRKTTCWRCSARLPPIYVPIAPAPIDSTCRGGVIWLGHRFTVAGRWYSVSACAIPMGVIVQPNHPPDMLRWMIDQRGKSGVAKQKSRPAKICLGSDPQDGIQQHVEDPAMRHNQVATWWLAEQAAQRLARAQVKIP